jgi:hypothetical protein
LDILFISVIALPLIPVQATADQRVDYEFAAIEYLIEQEICKRF